MASKTNCVINGKEYYRIRRKVGMKKNKAGNWVADYRLFYGKSKKEAESKYRAYISKPSLEADRPLGELIEQYIENVFLPDSTLKETTKTRYLNAFYSFFRKSRLSELPLSSVTGLDIQSEINSARVKPSSIKQAVNLLKRFYAYVSAQHIADDVTRALVLPQIEHKRKTQDIEIFTDDELRKFTELTPTEHRLRLLVILGMNTGARVAELLALKYSDFKEDHITISKALAEIEPVRDPDNAPDQDKEKTRAEIMTTKTRNSIRSVPINDAITKALEDHKKWHLAEMKKNGYKSDFVFTTSTGSLYFKSTVRTAFKRLCDAVGVPYKGFHTFRRTFGTKLAKAGVPIQTLSALMGHSDISVTARYYVNVPTDEKINAISKLKLY